ncbi:hypothetical protein AB0K35_25745 [Micromonospora sp. NPDC053740]|uniref:hypothetical protein n=1 Tax=Micromonospora sp. NPDC053740 TaxID=3155173 RepID=UPI00342D7F71
MRGVHARRGRWASPGGGPAPAPPPWSKLAVDLPAGLLARCLGIDISSAVDWQRGAAGDWHAYAARTALQRTSAILATKTAERLGRLMLAV